MEPACGAGGFLVGWVDGPTGLSMLSKKRGRERQTDPEEEKEEGSVSSQARICSFRCGECLKMKEKRGEKMC